MTTRRAPELGLAPDDWARLELIAGDPWDELLAGVLMDFAAAGEARSRARAQEAKSELLARVRRASFTVIDGELIRDESPPRCAPGPGPDREES